jgi:hypothetical protein
MIDKRNSIILLVILIVGTAMSGCVTPKVNEMPISPNEVNNYETR